VRDAMLLDLSGGGSEVLSLVVMIVVCTEATVREKLRQLRLIVSSAELTLLVGLLRFVEEDLSFGLFVGARWSGCLVLSGAEPGAAQASRRLVYFVFSHQLIRSGLRLT